MTRAQCTVALSLLLCAPASAFTFAEGYSSAAKGASARLYYRSFTIYTGEDACAHSAVPASFTIHADPLDLRVGGRIHRNGESELVIEAYDAEGTFLPSVPVVVNVVADSNVIESRADQDYFEALAAGEGQVTVSWFCGDVSASISVAVHAGQLRNAIAIAQLPNQRSLKRYYRRATHDAASCRR